jgi:heme/copper-type cytochrome/quinol oxidase subunit 2
MKAQIQVVSQADFDKWNKEKSSQSPAAGSPLTIVPPDQGDPQTADLGTQTVNRKP